jgi:hypothetical protein
MIKRVVALSVFWSLASAGPVCAAQVDVHQFDIGPEIYYFDYDEPGVMEEDGVFYGVAAGYAYHQTVMLGLEGRFAYGNVDYRSLGTGSIERIDDFLVEARATLGVDWNATDDIMLTPFSGYGYRYLNDDTGGKASTTGALGYERESNYQYTPFGLAARWSAPSDWSVTLSGEYDLFWDGTQKSHLSDAVASLNDLSNDQNDGHGARGSLAVEKKGQKVDWLLEGFLRWWDIDQSETAPVSVSGVIVGLAFEPANETFELGGRLTVRF